MIYMLFGLASGLLLVGSFIPYIRDAYRGSTQPHRITWIIILILNVISLANQTASGAKASLLFILGGVIGTFLVSIIALVKGVGGYEKLDIVCLIGGVLGLLAWWWLSTPLASIIANIVVAMIAFVPTYKKAWLQPETETPITWLLIASSAFLAILSVGGLKFRLLLIPVFSFSIHSGVYVVLRLRGRQLALSSD